MSLNLYLKCQHCQSELHHVNITHNLHPMATAAGLDCLWNPELHNIKTAQHLCVPLAHGIKLLEERPEEFKKLNPPNDWGDYNVLLAVTRRFLKGCFDHPFAVVEVSK